MKITDVKASVVFGRSVFVRVFTDEGIEGLGELRLADFLCDDHWLTLGWQLP